MIQVWKIFSIIFYVLEKVKKGVTRAEAEGAMKHDEVKKRLGKWLDT